ncbi:iron complex transport system ATP-binding protein [Actinobaculum suis]|uniref:Iron complex transport system ATP-binding protein n=1 Tax=Actinobaculum suis TaxID=1657 RepID=A0A0K9ETP9_9ACTO|nr:ABC transporter ATP-binding protein [Actinobaculum suis]KMY23579.1 histidinol phosphatase [Actinobaculum suis]OCA93676.1 histidinol phosphatase [Actinobaculum suis]OCA94203.1 histidinol phosphatase [Actinobaculum suis]SDE59094.1 iron complex transport system ATP-binding protein [Actinobaculum suis]
MIVAENITFKHILRGVSISIPDHGVTGLVGPNGSGKTTLLRCLFGALKISGGKVEINGKDLNSYRPRELAGEIAVVAQDSGEPPQISVAEIVRLGNIASGGQNDEIIYDSLARLGMEDRATSYLNQLSGGERQRVMIARGFAQAPRHLLFDEPTNHLDIRYQLEVLHEISKYPRSVTVVLHDLNFALQYCDYVYLLAEGEIVAAGEPKEVFQPEILEPVYDVRVTMRDGILRFERKK